jgi:hypothetical protein
MSHRAGNLYSAHYVAFNSMWPTLKQGNPFSALVPSQLSKPTSATVAWAPCLYIP